MGSLARPSVRRMPGASRFSVFAFTDAIEAGCAEERSQTHRQTRSSTRRISDTQDQRRWVIPALGVLLAGIIITIVGLFALGRNLLLPTAPKIALSADPVATEFYRSGLHACRRERLPALFAQLPNSSGQLIVIPAMPRLMWVSQTPTALSRNSWPFHHRMHIRARKQRRGGQLPWIPHLLQRTPRSPLSDFIGREIHRCRHSVPARTRARPRKRDRTPLVCDLSDEHGAI